MNVKKMTLLMALAFGAATALPASAGFDVVGDAGQDSDAVKPAVRPAAQPAPRAVPVMEERTEKPALPAAAALPTLTFSGVQQGAPKSITGMGKHVALVDALKQVVRFSGWHVYKDHEINAGQTVSWTGGGRPWTEVLEDVLNQANLTAQIDWTLKTITLHDRKPVTALPKVAKRDAVRDEVTQDFGDDGEVITSPAPKAAKRAVVWEASPEDRTVRNVIEKWAKQAGWQKPFWYPDNDYEVSAYVRLEGSFEEALRSIARNLSLEITVYQGNKIIVVREHN